MKHTDTDIKTDNKPARIPIQKQYTISPLPKRLSGTKQFWQKVFGSYYTELELVPHLYRQYTRIPALAHPIKVIVTNGNTLIYADISNTQILLTDLKYKKEALSEQDALAQGYIWYRPTMSLWLDNSNHYFIRCYAQRKFDLALIVPAYFYTKSLMPHDRASVTDGESRILSLKKDGATIVLLAGMKHGDPDWDAWHIPSES
jgi:hypothetical protein